MAITMSTTDGRRALEIARELNLPVTTVTNVLKAEKRKMVQELSEGKRVRIAGLATVYVHTHEGSDKISINTKSSTLLRRTLHNLGGLSIRERGVEAKKALEEDLQVSLDAW